MIFSCYENRWADGEIIHGADYYMEIIRPTLFENGSVRIFKHAHPDSLSMDHLIDSAPYECLEDMKWQFLRITEPIETVYGKF